MLEEAQRSVPESEGPRAHYMIYITTAGAIAIVTTTVRQWATEQATGVATGNSLARLVQIAQTVQPLRSTPRGAVQGSTVQKFNDITSPPFLLKDDHIRTAQG